MHWDLLGCFSVSVCLGLIEEKEINFYLRLLIQNFFSYFNQSEFVT